MKTLSMKNKTKGFSLIELMIVLAVIAAMTVVAFLVYPKVRSAREAHTVSVQLSSAAASIKSLYTNGEYSSLDKSVAIAADFFPGDMTSNGTATTITDSWGGAVTLSGADATGAAATTAPVRYFKITYANVPSDVCSKLVPAIIGNFGYVDVAGTAIQNKYAATPVPFDPSAVATACNVDGGVSVSVVGK